jgi:hypothetical protein
MIILLLSLFPRLGGAQSADAEYQVKAAFLFHFAQLVDWPVDAPGSDASSINLCVLEEEPQWRAIQAIVDGKPLGTRVFHVRVLHQVQDAQGCQLFFFSRDVARKQALILKSLRGLPVLTVGETDTFLADGGMICFHLDADRIRFDIRLEPAESSRLRISSRLLLLASNVVRASAQNVAEGR